MHTTDQRRPARKYSTFVFVLEGLVLILTCLLICYNPRDTAEDILVKTGAIIRTSVQQPAGGENGESKNGADLEGETVLVVAAVAGGDGGGGGVVVGCNAFHHTQQY